MGKCTCLFSIFLSLIVSYNFIFAQVIPLPNTHAHNDYEHERPLFDALESGITSVEVDVWLISGELYVSHNKPGNLKETPTLKELYLQPLNELMEKQDGFVYPGFEEPVFLMIDIKAEGEKVLKLLEQQVYEFPFLVSNPRLVIFLSGDRPMEQILGSGATIFALDGRPEDLGKGISPEKMPVVSQRYGKVIKWRGKGKLPRRQLETLKALANKTHTEGKKLRLWAMPQKPKVWRSLRAAGVDIINADDLDMVREFYAPIE